VTLLFLMPEFDLQQNPLVSVVIPTYNRRDLLLETIESVIAQTYANWELIIADDGSTDDTKAAVQSFHDNRIRYYYSRHSANLGKIRNFGIRNSKGSLIAFHDSDDLWRPDKLEFQVALFRRYPEAAFMLSNGAEFGDGSIHTPDYEQLFVGNLFDRILLHGDFCFYVPTWVVRRDVFDAFGPMGEFESTLHDIHLFFKIAHSSTGIFSNEKLVSIRKHKKSFSSITGIRAYLDTVPMLREFRDKNWISGSHYANLSAVNYYKMGMQYLADKNYPAAFSAFKHYTRIRQFHYKGYLRMLQSAIFSVR